MTSFSPYYLMGLRKVAEDAGTDPVELVRMHQRFDSRTLDRFAREDAALKPKPLKSVLKHALIGGSAGTLAGALYGIARHAEDHSLLHRESLLKRVLTGALIGKMIGVGAGTISGGTASLVDMLRSKAARREHMDQFLDKMYMQN